MIEGDDRAANLRRSDFRQVERYRDRDAADGEADHDPAGDQPRWRACQSGPERAHDEDGGGRADCCTTSEGIGDLAADGGTDQPPQSTLLTIAPSVSGSSGQSRRSTTIAPAMMPVSKPNSRPPIAPTLAINMMRRLLAAVAALSFVVAGSANI